MRKRRGPQAAVKMLEEIPEECAALSVVPAVNPPQEWQEVCAECHVHRGHRASCSTQRRAMAEMPADLSLKAYRQFLRNKARGAQEMGVDIDPGTIHPICKAHQRIAIEWLVRGGRRAIFASFGMGKTIIQLETLRLVLEKAGGRGLIVAPLGVRLEFLKDAAKLGTPLKFVRSIEECGDTGIYITNYETVRDGKLDPKHFTVSTLDEAAILRGFGGTRTFREFMRLFEGVKYRFVATATPSPNDYIELLAYSAYLGIMDVSGAKTKFFKRDSTKADNLTLQPSREKDFWLWMNTWSLWLERPSDLGPECSDDGYALPPMEVIYHEIPVNHAEGAEPERDGQGRMFREAAHGVVSAAREKRETMAARVAKACEIIAALDDGQQSVLWCDLNKEQEALAKALEEYGISYASLAGSESIDVREDLMRQWLDEQCDVFLSKPQMYGSGANLQQASVMVFTGIGFKFNEFIQALHRIYRFGQTRNVFIHVIYAESEKRVLETLLEKWKKHNEQRDKMRLIMQEYGLSNAALEGAMARGMGVEREASVGKLHTFAHNDCVEELHAEAGHVADNSVGLILTSIPFSTQYEYSPSLNDFGHTDGNAHFWQQMDFLIPQLLRVLMPGRLCLIHVKDRVVPGGVTGLGYQTVYPFHVDAIQRFMAHGFGYIGMKTIVTDVVRENNQTYRLGWTEQCKDGSKMGVGMPEYLLYFRKSPTENTKAYADVPVVKNKAEYSRSRWQVDAHGFMRAGGNRLLSGDDLAGLDHAQIFKLYRKHSLSSVYDFEEHVALGEALEAKAILPTTFMLLQPQSWHPDVWTDITRMRTLNMTQAQKGKEQHLCPMQEDVARRCISQMSNPGEVVLDPFGGIGTVPYWAVKLGRRGYGCELGRPYWLDGAFYCEQAEREADMPTLFDLMAVEEEGIEVEA